jgi:hypothetical protein
MNYDAFRQSRQGSGTGCGSSTELLVDGVVNGAASSTTQSALGSGWWDRWIVDGLVRFVGGFLNFQFVFGWIQTVCAELRAGHDGGCLILVGYVLWGK